MTFTPISVDDYVQLCIKHNPSIDAPTLRQGLKSALEAHKNDQRCACGNELWVIGSAHGGRTCYDCFAGKKAPDFACEIKAAIRVSFIKERRRYMNEMFSGGTGTYRNDDGTEIDMDSVKKPAFCLRCENDDDPCMEILCNLTRCDREEGEEFTCGAFRKREE
ncbi:MAG: hypothetical protein ABR572_11120 [Cryomorphaceae bacterium]|nr:hypothetical protein [Flavobacteriales bacterium]